MTKSKPPTRDTEDEKQVQLGVRVPGPLHFALKTACLHQQDGKQPQTQADIVGEALRERLSANGYEEVIQG